MDNNVETKNENKIGARFLPIGTVVMLKGGTKRAMITGFCSIAQEDTSKMYDYSGCIYPEGYLSSDRVCLFNHDQIDKVYYMGLIDEEEVKFKNKLTNILSKVDINQALAEANAKADKIMNTDDSDNSGTSTTTPAGTPVTTPTSVAQTIPSMPSDNSQN